MARIKLVSVEDVSLLMRLADRLHRLPDDGISRKNHLLHELYKWTDAAICVCALSSLHMDRPGGLVAPLRIVGHSSDAGTEALHRYFETRLPPDPVMHRLPELRGRLDAAWTGQRHDAVDDQAWYDSPHVREVRQVAGIDHCVHSFIPLPDHDLMAELWVARPWRQRRPFTSRHVRLIDLAHTHSAWIYESESRTPWSQLDSLPPRQRQTMEKLFTGDSEKEIAAALHLSPNTVHHYVKAIYRRFGVSSRSELLARFLPRREPFRPQ